MTEDFIAELVACKDALNDQLDHLENLIDKSQILLAESQNESDSFDALFFSEEE